MARKKETDELDDFEFDFEDDDDDFDFEEDYDDEDDYESDDDEDEDFTDDPVYKKIAAKAKADAEAAVVAALTSEDTESPVYKGMQKVVNKKDNEIKQLKQQLEQYGDLLSGVAGRSIDLGNNSVTQKAQVDALIDVIGDMLNTDEDRKILRQRLNQASEKTELETLKSQVKMLTSGNNGYGNGQRQQQESQNDEFAEYRKQASETLKGIAEEAGIDVTDKRLQYGKEEDSLLDRMVALKESIRIIKKEGDPESVRKARRKVPQSRTRDDAGSGDMADREYGRNLIAAGSAQMAKKMRKVAFK